MMVEKSGTFNWRFFVGIMPGTSLMLIALAVWMIVKGEGSPVFVAVAGAMLASFAGITADQSQKKR